MITPRIRNIIDHLFILYGPVNIEYGENHAIITYQNPRHADNAIAGTPLYLTLDNRQLTLVRFYPPPE